MSLAVITSHPIQYYAPLFRELAGHMDVEVLYMHRATSQDQAGAGFGVHFEWDIDLLSGYPSKFLSNVAGQPGLHHFGGVDVPEVGAALMQGRFDAVLVTGWHLKGYVQAIGAARRLGLPIIVRGDSQLQTQRSRLKQFGKRVIYPLLLRAFDAALYVGARSKAYWRHYGYPEHRLFFSPHCVDNDWFAARAGVEAGVAVRRKLGVTPQASLVLFAGKLLPFKRPLDLVDACALLCSGGREVQLMVAGSGVLEQAIQQRAAAGKVPLHMIGFLNQSEMPAAYAAADVVVLPSSSSETWGLVVNEALACGTPVLVSEACGSAPDLAADGIAGATYPTGNIEALAATLVALLDRPPGPDRIARKISQYSIASAAAGIEAARASLTKRENMITK